MRSLLLVALLAAPLSAAPIRYTGTTHSPFGPVNQTTLIRASRGFNSDQLSKTVVWDIDYDMTVDQEAGFVTWHNMDISFDETFELFGNSLGVTIDVMGSAGIADVTKTISSSFELLPDTMTISGVVHNNGVDTPFSEDVTIGNNQPTFFSDTVFTYYWRPSFLIMADGYHLETRSHGRGTVVYNPGVPEPGAGVLAMLGLALSGQKFRRLNPTRNSD